MKKRLEDAENVKVYQTYNYMSEVNILREYNRRVDEGLIDGLTDLTEANSVLFFDARVVLE